MAPTRRCRSASPLLGISTSEPARTFKLIDVRGGLIVVSFTWSSFVVLLFVVPLLDESLLLLPDDISDASHCIEDFTLLSDHLITFGQRWQGAGDGA